jgi:hypothetical protein
LEDLAASTFRVKQMMLGKRAYIHSYISLECERVAESTSQHKAGKGSLAASDTSGRRGDVSCFQLGTTGIEVMVEVQSSLTGKKAWIVVNEGTRWSTG